MNTQNVRIWGSERPSDANQEFDRNAPKLNVFCAMNGFQIIGPYFFPNDTVNANDYCDMLNTWFLPKLRNKTTAVFQQDGAPPHWSLATRALLNTTFPGRWIGRAGATDQNMLDWPPRSPDITPLDFFLWGYVKDDVFTLPFPETVEQMKVKIQDAIKKISRALLEKVHESFRRKLKLVIEKKGSHIENR